MYFSNGDGVFKDEQTGSTWNHTGLVIEELFQGEQLSSLPHHDSFRFV
jgi:hypothetical protein